MRTIALFSALALGALTSAALAEPVATTTPAKSAATAAAPAKMAPAQAGRLELSDHQMDGIKAGQGKGSLATGEFYACNHSRSPQLPFSC
jgi:hypothetical protein